MNTTYIALAAAGFSIAGLSAAVIIYTKKLKKANALLAEQASKLVQYSTITDAEEEAKRIILEAGEQATSIFTDATKEADSTVNAAKASAKEIADQATRSIREASVEADMIVKNAKEAADLLVSEAKEEQKNTKQAISDAKQELQSVHGEIRLLRDSYSEKKSVYDKLLEKVKLYQEQSDLSELAFYEPIFSFDTAEKYKQNIISIRDKQKAMLKDKTVKGAIHCSKDWTVGNSRREGQKMVNRAMTLSMRAFNGECEAAIASCTFKNYLTMRERIGRAYDAVNKANEVLEIYINHEYYNLKLKELQAVFEYSQKKYDEKEEQKALREQIRDEEKAQREIEKAIREAEEEERRAEKALLKAQKQMEDKLAELRANDTEKNRAKAQQYQDEIDRLNDALAEAQSKGERALSMAQQTKRGHVYIISNIGAFGENVFKIGLTRRLDPQDRVDELGSASVPFLFDVHAMIKSDDAPALETALHQHFDKKRTNAINRRKEFFNVTLDEIKEAVANLCGDSVDFVETATAQHYYETLALRKAEQKAANEEVAQSTKQPEFAEAI